MSARFIGTKFYGFDPKTGKPLEGGLLYTYQARSNKPKVTYSDEDMQNANPNPVVLNDAGYANVVLHGSYKLVLKNSSGTEIWTDDPVTDSSRQWSEWGEEFSATQVSATEFDIPGDVTADMVLGEALQLFDASVLYGTVSDVQLVTGSTRVTVALDSGSLSNSLSSISVPTVRGARDYHQFKTVAAMTASSSVKVGDIAEVAEYAAGRGGSSGGRFLIGSGFGTADNIGYIFDLPGGKQAKNLFINGYATPEQFGAAVGQDATSAIEITLNTAAALALPVHFRQVTYTVTANIALSATSHLIVHGNNCLIDCTGMPQAQTGTDVQFLTVSGTAGSDTAISADVAEHDVQISVPDSLIYAPGQMILLHSDDPYTDGAAGGNKRGEIFFVDELVNATTISIHTPSRFVFRVASNARIRPIDPVENVHIHDMRVVMGGKASGHSAIKFYRAKNCSLERCAVEYAENRAVTLAECYGVSVRDCAISHATSPSNSSNPVTTTGYGTVIGEASRECSATGNHYLNCRHAVAGGGGFTTGPALIDGNTVNGSLGAGLDCHEDCLDWVFSNNLVATDNHTGILIRGRRCAVVGNKILGGNGGSSAGITVAQLGVANPDGMDGCTISGNSINVGVVPGINIAGTVNNPIRDVIIAGNLIERAGAGDGALVIKYATNVQVSGGAIKNRASSRALVVNDSQGVSVSGVSLENAVYSSSLPAVWFVNTDHVTLNGCLFLKNTWALIDGCEYVSVNNCRQDNATGDSASMPFIIVDDSSYVGVQGCSGEAQTGTTNASANMVQVRGTVRDLVVSGCYGRYGKLVRTLGPGHDIDYVTVVGCNARNCTSGPYIDLPGVINYIKENNFE